MFHVFSWIPEKNTPVRSLSEQTRSCFSSVSNLCTPRWSHCLWNHLPYTCGSVPTWKFLNVKRSLGMQVRKGKNLPIWKIPLQFFHDFSFFLWGGPNCPSMVSSLFYFSYFPFTAFLIVQMFNSFIFMIPIVPHLEPSGFHNFFCCISNPFKMLEAITSGVLPPWIHIIEVTLLWFLPGNFTRNKEQIILFCQWIRKPNDFLKLFAWPLCQKNMASQFEPWHSTKNFHFQITHSRKDRKARKKHKMANCLYRSRTIR